MGLKSPAKVLRSTKRLTNFLKNKWRTGKKLFPSLDIFHAHNISIPPKPIPNLAINHVQRTNVPPSCPPLPCSFSKHQNLSSQPEVMNLKRILNQYDEERESERENFNIERKREREKDHEKFKRELEKLMLDSALPP